MPAKKKEEKKGIMYNGKPLIRKGSQIYYGDPEQKYIISMTVTETAKIIDLDVSSAVTVQLQTVAPLGRETVLKKAERDGLSSALELGEWWLNEALEEGVSN